MILSHEEFNGRIYDHIRDKIFLSNISGMPVTVVQKLPEQIKPGKVLFDGIMLFDGIEGCPCEEAVMKECEARSIII